jgi:hypothetical protein
VKEEHADEKGDDEVERENGRKHAGFFILCSSMYSRRVEWHETKAIRQNVRGLWEKSSILRAKCENEPIYFEQEKSQNAL